MRKIFTIKTSSDGELDQISLSIQELLNDRRFTEFVIAVPCEIYNSNAFREWLDTLTAECNNNDFYHCWELDGCIKDFSDSCAGKRIVFRKDYEVEEIAIVKEQRNGYARKVEELEEAIKEYQYGIVPGLEVKCKNQAKEITYLHKKIEKLNEATEALKEKQTEIVRNRDTALKHLEIEKTKLLERNKRLMNDNVLLKTMYDEISKDMDTSAWKLAINTSSFIRNTNKKFNAVDAKLNDIADHLRELDKFRDSIKKEGDNKYD